MRAFTFRWQNCQTLVVSSKCARCMIVNSHLRHCCFSTKPKFGDECLDQGKQLSISMACGLRLNDLMASITPYWTITWRCDQTLLFTVHMYMYVHVEFVDPYHIDIRKLRGKTRRILIFCSLCWWLRTLKTTLVIEKQNKKSNINTLQCSCNIQFLCFEAL